MKFLLIINKNTKTIENLVDKIKNRICLKYLILLIFIIWTIGHILIEIQTIDTQINSIWHFFMYQFMTWVFIQNYIIMKPELIDSNLLESLKFSSTYRKAFKFLFNFLNILIIISVFANSIISLIKFIFVYKEYSHYQKI